MPPGRKIKSGLFLGLLIFVGLIAVDFISPRVSWGDCNMSAGLPSREVCRGSTPSTCEEECSPGWFRYWCGDYGNVMCGGSQSVSTGGACEEYDDCSQAGSGNSICAGGRCHVFFSDVPEDCRKSWSESAYIHHVCIYAGTFMGDGEYCCGENISSEECEAHCLLTPTIDPTPTPQPGCGSCTSWTTRGCGDYPCAGGERRYTCSAGAPDYCVQCRAECAAPTATPTASACPWDIIKTGTSNGKVDAVDLAELNRCYSPLGGVGTDCQAADLNHNGVINALDYSLMIMPGHWGNCP